MESADRKQEEACAAAPGPPGPVLAGLLGEGEFVRVSRDVRHGLQRPGMVCVCVCLGGVPSEEPLRRGDCQSRVYIF